MRQVELLGSCGQGRQGGAQKHIVSLLIWDDLGIQWYTMI